MPMETGPQRIKNVLVLGILLLSTIRLPQVKNHSMNLRLTDDYK